MLTRNEHFLLKVREDCCLTSNEHIFS